MNKVIAIGNLTKDPEIKYSQAGKAVTNFTVAVGRPFKNAQGENETDFLNCVTFGKTAENLAQYQQKGNKVAVEGRVQTRNYENKEGQRVFVTEIVVDNVQFLDKKPSNKLNQNQANELAETLGAEVKRPEPQQMRDSDMLPF